MSARHHILHLHSTFSLGGKEARAARLMNAFGDSARHSIVSAMPDSLDARDAIEPGIDVVFPSDAPSLTGKPTPGRIAELADYTRRFDLVLTYNWGAMDAVMAHRLARKALPPLIHHEDGFNADEADRLKASRTFYRRFAFPTLHRLVVPSDRLADIARKIWRQPERRILQIANGIPVQLYQAEPQPDAIPGFERQSGDVVIGTIAGLREVKDLPRLVRAVAALPDHVKLVIVGEGPERETIYCEALADGIADRVLLAGFLDRPWRYAGHFDIFALSSRSEQFPISVVEAMAAGLPVASPDVGDIWSMVAGPNRELLQSDRGGLEPALAALVEDAGLRRNIGEANRERAIADYDEAAMIDAYDRLYGEALGQERLRTA